MSATVTETTVMPVEPTPTPTPEPEREQPTLTQSQVNALLAEERRKANEKAAREREQSESKAKQDALKEQGEYKSLAEDRAARITELEAETGTIETLTQERDAALSVVADLVKEELKTAPEYVAEAIADRDAVAQLQYLNKNRDKWAQPTVRGGGPLPRPANTEMTRDDIKDKYLRQAGVTRP